jgi:hypothetical protein
MKKKVSIRIKKGVPLLQAVRLIKINSGLDLRTAKNIVEKLINNPNEQEILEVNFKSFKEELENLNLEDFILVRNFDYRNTKILELGIADNEDYISYITENYDFLEKKDIYLEEILKKLSKEQIEDVFNNMLKFLKD